MSKSFEELRLGAVNAGAWNDGCGRGFLNGVARVNVVVELGVENMGCLIGEDRKIDCVPATSG